MTREQLADRLDVYRTYRVPELQELLGIPAVELIDGALTGDIARFLGEGPQQMTLLGADVAMWLRGEDPWPSAAGSEAADTVGCRMARIKTPMSDRQSMRQKALREQAALDAAPPGVHADERKDGAAGCEGPATPDQNPNLAGGRVMAAKHATAGARAPQTTASDSDDVRFLPLDAIELSHDNPRQTFDADGIADLATSLQTVGLLQPIVVRPIDGERFELVCGERRYRAASLLEWSDIRATVRDLTDTEAAELRLLENLDREDLSALEEASAFLALRELGHDTASLANLIRRSEADIETREGLLRLPEFWTDMLAAGEISAPFCEYLVPYVDHPSILEALEEHAGFTGPLAEWRRKVLSVVRLMSRPMDEGHPDSPLFDPDEEIAERLDIVAVPVRPGQFERRAFNTRLFDECQDVAESSAGRTTAADDEGLPASGDPIVADDESGSAQDIAASNGHAAGPLFGDEYFQRLAAWKTDWLRSLISRHLQTCDLDELTGFCELLAIDPAREWYHTREFLQLHDHRQLVALADEAGVDLSDADDADEARAILLHLQPEAMPANVADVDERVAPPVLA